MILEGKNAVREALVNRNQIDKIFIKKGYENGSLKEIKDCARKNGVVVQLVDRKKLDFMSESKNHQGIIAVCPEKNYCDVGDILEFAHKKNEAPLIVILDEINDPRNFGAIIRTCECFGVHGIIIPKRRNVGLTGIVAKASAGAIEHVLIAKVSNLVYAIEDLKKRGVWITCADMSGENLERIDFKTPSAIVIGNEGLGIKKLIREKSDFVAKICMHGKINCLNASVAAGVLLYEATRQRYSLK